MRSPSTIQFILGFTVHRLRLKPIGCRVPSRVMLYLGGRLVMDKAFLTV